MIDWRRVERVLVALIVLHSVGVGVCLLFATRWSVGFGGWGSASPLFFPRQAGIFHFVVAAAYAVEYVRYRGVTILVCAKSLAVVFLLSMTAVDGGPWTLPASAVADGAMGAAVLFVRRRASRG